LEIGEVSFTPAHKGITLKRGLSYQGVFWEISHKGKEPPFLKEKGSRIKEIWKERKGEI